MPLSVSHSWNSGAWQTQPASRLLSTHQLPPLALDSRSRGLAPALPRTSHLSFLLYLPWERAGRLRPPRCHQITSPPTPGKVQRTPYRAWGSCALTSWFKSFPFTQENTRTQTLKICFLKKKAKYSPKQKQQQKQKRAPISQLKKKAISGSEVQEGEGLCVPMADSVRVGLWRKLSAEELMLLNCGVGEDSWESLGLQGDPTSPF